MMTARAMPGASLLRLTLSSMKSAEEIIPFFVELEVLLTLINA
jgi:hypothetical protein